MLRGSRCWVRMGRCAGVHETHRGRECGRGPGAGVGGAQEVQRHQQDTDDAGDVETQARHGVVRDADGHDTRACAGRTQARNARAKVDVNVCTMDTRKALGVRGEDA